MSFGEKLKALREIKRLTQQELADKAGLSRAFVSALELERTLPAHASAEAMVNLAKGLDMNPLDLLKVAGLWDEEESNGPQQPVLEPGPQAVAARSDIALEGLTLKDR